ncbi:BREX-2 system adenine-specific DNA-methyltransferase PglX [Pseudarthrobacter sp. BRE9]|uniref:BREX-2 system adenine-specific DNA-methyltransferase PglX n=1 Tax=Pseudarthrobacter sp. BRE9 TaxID=2962582 RepID=UPI002880FB0C|nr:BREX-2 system adenine-specific DNA-methyltransferase PglX [Pseudarthrobacter sp. BRE9]MDT0169753.1 BREX-2 system adenine-specific DNA-methyltransferase PglX [Pseudarthrobacter sp. BRE9]
MIDSSALLADLKAQLRVLQADLKSRADDPGTAWGAVLQREHAEALRRERTGLSWSVWRDNEVDQAAVAWVLATTFVRFCEDNDLLMGAVLDGVPVPVSWIAGPGDRVLRARENQTAYFRVNRSHHDRDWLQQSFRVLAAQPAGAALVDPRHNPVWTAEISAEAAKGLVDFWRRTRADGALVHDFTDPDLDTRFLGDLYQDLSDHAKKTYALLQTPVFVEEFILDRTLTPAIAEFGVDGLKVIDPTCGSGHFLLGAFERLNEQWAAEAPGLDPRQRVRKAMDSIHGVDLNPFAVAIARFRLTVAGILAAGEKSLVGLEEWGFHLAIGDSLLGEQGVTNALFGEDAYAYSTEDLGEYTNILKPGQYHVVVGNPPYITVKDRALNRAYRAAYATTHRQYALTVPFMELFFRLAIRGEQGQSAGYVGQITGNGFMKREFGKLLVEDFFGGRNIKLGQENPVDLVEVVDSSGAYIPGHGTPTVILVGRRRRPVSPTVRAVLGVRGEPGIPANPANGLVWTEIVAHVGDPGYDGTFVSVTDLDRSVLSKHPWSLGGGGASDLKQLLESSASSRVKDVVAAMGLSVVSGEDEFYFLGEPTRRLSGSISPGMRVVRGDEVRDYATGLGEVVIWTQGDNLKPLAFRSIGNTSQKLLWMFREHLSRRKKFGISMRERGLTWWEWREVYPDKIGKDHVIIFPLVATHNHFMIDRTGAPVHHSATVIQLPADASEEQFLGMFGLMNTSSACFWLKQVSHSKGGDQAEPWGWRYEFTGTKLKEYPLPVRLPGIRGGVLDDLAQQREMFSPSSVVARWVSGSGEESLAGLIEQSERRWVHTVQRMVFEQEELDWETYALYELVDEPMTYTGSSIEDLQSGQRAFEIALARRIDGGEEESAWFERHGSKQLHNVPADWPEDYRVTVEKRLAVLESDWKIRMLERPEYKRRWVVASWDEQLRDSLHAAILDRLEDADLWRDHQGTTTRSVAQLADMLRHDQFLLDLARELTSSQEPDLVAVFGSLASTEAVPYLAAYRYKPSGLEKFREWQTVWDLQRREDAGDRVTIQIPDKYSSLDFQRVEYWKARGKLDVPKERFVLYPGVRREGDNSPVLGWAGWSHRDQAVALVREVMDQQALGASNEALVPMVAGLVELEPWLHQWHTELEPEFGSSAAQAVTSQIDQLLAQLRMTRADVNAWRPPTAARGRRRST